MFILRTKHAPSTNYQVWHFDTLTHSAVDYYGGSYSDAEK